MKVIDARAWLIWVGAALIIALTAFNPWYHLLLIGVVALIWPAQRGAANDAEESTDGLMTPRMLIRIGLIALVFGAVFNMLAVRVGDTVLVRLPDSIPIIGGPLYLEALVYGLLNALRVISILCVFALFSNVVRYADILRLAPPAFFDLGLIVSIGFTLVPFTRRAYRDIREAQTLRGHRPRGLRDMLPLVSPLVVSGMERSLMLAESMEARGYGGGLPNAEQIGSMRRHQLQLVLVLSAIFLILGAYTFRPFALPVLWGALGSAAALMLWALRKLSRLSGRTRLRQGHWGFAESLLSLGALLALVAVLVADHALLVWDVYRLSAVGLPGLNPWLAAALLGLAAPLLIGAEPKTLPEPQRVPIQSH